jgi:hypothetical protein
MWISAALLCVTIVASSFAIYSQYQLNLVKKEYDELLDDIFNLEGDLDELTILVDINIDYGNGSSTWYNETRIPINSNLLYATQTLVSVDYSTSEFGAIVDNINRVGGDKDTYWIWQYYDPNEKSWEFGAVASDNWILHKGDVVSWSYTSF